MVTQTRLDGIAFSDPTDGRIVIPPNSDVTVPGAIQQLGNGAAFGPLGIAPTAGETVTITRLGFPELGRSAGVPTSDRSAEERLLEGGTAAGFAAGAITSGRLRTNDGSEKSWGPPLSSVRRRTFLTGAGTLLGAGLLASRSAGSRVATDRPHVELGVQENTGGFHLGFVSRTAAEETQVTAYELRLDGDYIGAEDVQSDQWIRVPAERTGRVTLHLSDASIVR